MLKINDIDLEALASGEQSNSQALAALQDHIAALEAHPNVPSGDMQAIKDGLTALQAKMASDEATITADHADILALHASIASATPASIQVTPAQILTALLAALGAAPAAGTGAAGTPAPQPGPAPAAIVFTGSDVNTGADLNHGQYPFAMPTVAPAAVIEVGIPGPGMDVLEVVAANNPGQAAPCTFGIALRKPNGLVMGLTGPLTITSYAGMQSAGSQIIRVHAPFGENPCIELPPQGNGNGTSGLFINSATLNGAPLAIYGQLNSRAPGVLAPFGQPTTFVSASDGIPVLMQPIDANTLALYGLKANGSNPNAPAAGSTPDAGPAIPPKNATASIVTGATLNGTVLPPDTIANLFAAANNPGDHLVLPAGLFIGSGRFAAKGGRLSGAGGAFVTDPTKKTVISCKGFRPYQDKAVIVIGADCDADNIATCDAAIIDMLGANAAGWRGEADGINYNLTNCESYNNQDGELTDIGNFTHTNCHFHDNGVAPTSSAYGYDHDDYINGNAGSMLNVIGGLFEKTKGGHALKSRAGTNNISGGATFESGDGNCLEFPAGGKISLKDVTLRKPAGAADHRFLSAGMESAINAAAGMSCSMENVTLIDPDANGIIQANNGMTLTIAGKSTFDVAPPLIIGWTPPVVGQFVKAG